MLGIALKMLMGDRAKFVGLLLGIGFTAFLVTFAASYFAGFMTRGFALIAEDGTADVWVMDPAVQSVEQTIDLPDAALGRVRSVAGVGAAVPLSLGRVTARFPNGRFQDFQLIGVDAATLIGAPRLSEGQSALALRGPDAAIVDAGGTRGKLQTPSRAVDQWPHDGPHLAVPTRTLRAGDTLEVDGRRVRIVGQSRTLPRFPPRPLLYTTYDNAARLLPGARHRLTFVLVMARPGADPEALAVRIQARTGLRARSADQFIRDTVAWYLVNSEDVGDMGSMLMLAMVVGFGLTGILLYLFTADHLAQYAVLKAMGATPRTLLTMVLGQAALCALLGTALGVGVCALVGEIAGAAGYPFRMLWFTPIVGAIGVVVVTLTAAAISVRPVLRLQPMAVFGGH